jgi:hypothetical protein
MAIEFNFDLGGVLEDVARTGLKIWAMKQQYKMQRKLLKYGVPMPTPTIQFEEEPIRPELPEPRITYPDTIAKDLLPTRPTEPEKPTPKPTIPIWLILVAGAGLIVLLLVLK